MTAQNTARLCAALILAAACHRNAPTGPTVPVDRQVTLAPGQTAAVDGTPLRVTFLRVSGDSRCPADAVCIQGGDALVHIRAQDGTAPSDYELHTGDASRAAVSHGGYRIELASLEPYPFSSRTIQPDDYRATLKVTR